MLKTILLNAVTQKMLKGIALTILEHFAQKSDNKLDDKLVNTVKEALN